MVLIKQLNKNTTMPAYESKFAVGLDVHASIPHIVNLLPKHSAIIPCGFSLELPIDVEAQIRPRSGIAARYGVTVLNSPGTIDPDYRGEIQVILINHGDKIFSINPNDRIAQIVFSSIKRVDLEFRENLTSTERGSNGFGSTGI